MRTYHYTINAHNGINEKGWFLEGVQVDILHALDEDDAISQAKKLVNERKIYTMGRVWECHECEREKQKSPEVKNYIKEASKFMKKLNKEDEDE